MNHLSKLFLGLLLSILFFSCTEETLLQTQEFSEVKLSSRNRTIEDAFNIVETIVRGQGQDSRSAQKRIDKDNVNFITGHKSRGENIDTLIYVVNFADDEGFVLVSAKRNAQPVLAIIDSGNFDSTYNSGNEQFAKLIDAASDYVTYIPVIIPDPLPPTPDTIKMAYWEDSVAYYKCFPPRIKVQWDQSSPANKFCPNGVAGCAPLAIAQAMTFFKNVHNLTLTYAGKDRSSIELDWDDILKHKTSSYIGSIFGYESGCCAASSETHDNIGRLVRQIGEDLKSTYYKSDLIYGTSTVTVENKIPPVLTKYFPDTYIYESKYFSLACGYLSDDANVGVVNMMTMGEDGVLETGHTLVADGSAWVKRTYYIYYDYVPETGAYSSREVIIKQDDDYLHLNWGQGGYGDGYYLVNLLDYGYCVQNVDFNTTAPSGGDYNAYKGHQKIWIISTRKIIGL